MKGQTPTVATEAVGALFAAFAEVLIAMIGEPLTIRLLQEAWPDAFTDASAEET